MHHDATIDLRDVRPRARLARVCCGALTGSATVACQPAQTPAPLPTVIAVHATQDAAPVSQSVLPEDAGPVDGPTPIDLPETACVVEGEAPAARTDAHLGFSDIYLAGAHVAALSALGVPRRVSFFFSDGAPDFVPLSFDSSLVAVRGETPIRSSVRDQLELYPRARVLREGWLDYGLVHAERTRGAEIEPATTLPAWITPAFAQPVFRVPCTELTPFGAVADVVPNAKVSQPSVALEDQKGRRVATIDVAAKSKDGLPVATLETAKGRTKVRFEIGRDLRGEGWLPSKLVVRVAWGGLGYGTGSGRLGASEHIACDVDTPLWVHVDHKTFVWGALHAHQSFRGKLTDEGFGILAGGDDAARPFVPRAHLGPCTIHKSTPTGPARLGH